MVRLGVTGATGFIGGALVPFLAAGRYELVPVDDRTGPIEASHLDQPAGRLRFESEDALGLLSHCDAILHLAAVSGVMACAADPVGTARVNVEGTRKLVERCREERIPIAFASSFAVVGAPAQLPVTESTPPAPTHEYARQKAAGEEIVRSLGREGVVPSAVVRMSNVYGGYRLGPRRIAKGNVIEMFSQQANGGHLAVNAPGTQRRDYIHLDDVVAHWEAVARFLLRPRATAEDSTFNVASGEAFSVLEVADKVARHFAAQYPQRPALRIDVVPNPRGGVELVEPEFAVSRAQTERLLGLACRRSVDEALPSILRERASV